jgi:hypothetical protein
MLKPRQKTGGLSLFPLLPPAEQILGSFSLTGAPNDFWWNIISNKKMNKRLKDIAEKAGLVKKLLMHWHATPLPQQLHSNKVYRLNCESYALP